MLQIDAKAVSVRFCIFLMMENAGNALARYMLKGLNNGLRGKKIAVVCGISNNGDVGGLAFAYYRADVIVIILGKSVQLWLFLQ
jgi:NAD(P)H-hydrate repair Nnr-like enzyme with NAD(P)H-hydrate epimerase domain